MQQDKDSVYPGFASDSLASCNLCSCTNIYIYPQTTCNGSVCVCVQCSLAGHASCCLNPHVCLFTQTGHLSLRTHWGTGALPCLGVRPAPCSLRLFLGGHGPFIVIHKPATWLTADRSPHSNSSQSQCRSFWQIVYVCALWRTVTEKKKLIHLTNYFNFNKQGILIELGNIN